MRDPYGYAAYPYGYGYGYGYGSYGYAGDVPCGAYPRAYGYYPEFVVAPLAVRHVAPTETWHNRPHRIDRPGTDSTVGSAGSSSGSSSPAPSAPRMAPAPASAPAPAPTTVRRSGN